jgi:hypothetical protein
VQRTDGAAPLQVLLRDDGAHGDGAAADGVYGGVFTPTQAGAYVVQYAATGVDHGGRVFVRHSQVAFSLPRLAAYIYTESDLPQSYGAYRALLNESATPLMGVPMHAVTSTQWNRLALIMVGADSAAAGQDWLTPAARTAVTSSLLPVLGLYNGGYELFRNYGLALGSNVTRTGNMTRTTPFDPSAPVWQTPYPLSGATPYTVYTRSEGLNVNLGSFVPGVTNIGLQPGTPRYNIVREDERFVLFGFRRGPELMSGDGRRIFKNLAALLMP